MTRRPLLALLLATTACSAPFPEAGEDVSPATEEAEADAMEMALDRAAEIAQHPAELSVDDYAPDRLLVGFRGEVPAFLDIPGARLKAGGPSGPLPLARYDVPAGVSLAEAVDRLLERDDVAFAEPDLIRTVTSAGDPYRSYQWHLDAAEIPGAWHQGALGNGVVVAVIDTGVSTGGQETPAMVAGYDFVDDDADAEDLHGHGTHVAGTIAQRTNDGVGAAGVAPGAEVMPIRVLGADGSGTTSDVVNGIVWAVQSGADILNLSLGSANPSSAEQLAVEWAVGEGVLVIAAAGNDGQRSVSYPAAYEAALAVGALGQLDRVAPYSNTGSALALMAPGGDLTTDVDGDGYGDGVLQETFGASGWGWYFFQGTSMAAPHAAGAAALLVGAGATPAEAGQALLDGAADLGAAGWDDRTGHGALDALAALEAWQDTTEPDPDPDPGEDEVEPGDTTPPTANAFAARKRGDRIALRVHTNEPATVEICEPGRSRCETTELARMHRIRFATEGNSVLLRATDAAGNTRYLDPITVD